MDSDYINKFLTDVQNSGKGCMVKFLFLCFLAVVGIIALGIWGWNAIGELHQYLFH